MKRYKPIATGRSTSRIKSTGTYKPPVHPQQAAIDKNKAVPSVADSSAFLGKKPKRYTAEMAERERVAREEVERKKTMVAPICNKSNYVYIGGYDAEMIKNLGKKL